MAEIELFPHNEEGYQALVKSLEFNNFSFLERATGTGKSYIILKYLYNYLVGKRVLFVTLHDSMFKQLVTKDMPTLGFDKKVFNKMDCILYNSLPKHDATWYYDNYDCIIFDEAHHCGAPKWGSVVSDLRDLITSSEDKKMIGLTATGTRYLDDYMDVAKEFFDGNVASKLYISDAILREILPAPYYINLNHYTLDKIIEVKRKLHKLEKYSELDELRMEVDRLFEEITKKESINSLLKKHNVQAGEKYILFCNNIDEIKKKKEEVEAWFDGIAPIEIYEAHSRQKKDVNDKAIDEFKNNNNPNTIKIMFAVDMFNEGLHINSVDGLIMIRHTTSPIIYLQQLGRALSFSSRRKQIKVFDLVGNATDIDIIHNLYKELLAVAREEIEKGNGNLQHYQEIIDRFQIVEEGSEIVSRIEEVNSYLDNNYFDKEKIRRNIFILTNFIDANDVDFMYLLKSGQLSETYLKIYRELQKLSDSLTVDDFVQLNKIGVFLMVNQDSPIFIEKIKKYGNLGNANEGEIKELFDKINLFYQVNHRRPNILDKEEANLVRDYRDMLFKSNIKYVSKYLKKSDYPLNIEELLLLKDYPSREDIDKYLDYIEEKYKGNIELDDLEKISINRLNKIFSFKDRPLIDSIANNQVARIDAAIKILQGFLVDNPGEKFNDIGYYKDYKDVYRALQVIDRYYNYVTDIQFKTLLDMKIKLPKGLNMTFEERRKILGKYHSFYEKEAAKNYSDFKIVVDYISKTGKRPGNDSEEEKEVSRKLKRFTSIKGNIWSKKTIDVLVEHNIDLTIDEKIVSGFDIKQEDLDTVAREVLDFFNNIDLELYNNFILRKKISFLRYRHYLDDKLYKIYIRTIAIIEYITTCRRSREDLKKYILTNQTLIPYGLLDYIDKKFNISIPTLNRASKNKKKNEISLAYKKYREYMDIIDYYINYIKKNGERPPSYSVESKELEKYLVGSSSADVGKYCDRLSSIGVEPNTYELYLAGIASEVKQLQLYNELKEKRRRNYSSLLDRHVYKMLKYKFENNIVQSQSDSLISDLVNETKDDEYSAFIKEIEKDPWKEIDFSNGILNETRKQQLREYRLILLAKLFIPDVIKLVKEKNEPYKDLLESDKLELLDKVIKTNKRHNINLELISELDRVNKNVIFSSNNMELFVNEYLDFCKKNSRRPELLAEDPDEDALARKYKVLGSVMEQSEKTKFDKEVSKIIVNETKIDFYSSFIEFVEKNKRFPTVLAKDNEEISLAKEYQRLGLKLNLEQRKKIMMLQKKYQLNSIMYIKSLEDKNGNKL